jgi:hypothetical protein
VRGQYSRRRLESKSVPQTKFESSICSWCPRMEFLDPGRKMELPALAENLVLKSARLTTFLVLTDRTTKLWGSTINRRRFLRNRSLEKTAVYLCRLCRSQVGSAEWAGTQAISRSAYHGHLLPPYRHLRADGAIATANGRVRKEVTCPLAKPLVESLHLVLAHWAANMRQLPEKGQ